MACSSCGTNLPPQARYCPTCGTPQASDDEERRVITVLFADVVGFTGIAEQMDPEKVKRLMDDTFQRLANDITSHGGVVDKVLGDEIIALFGAPVAHSDDAERAVRAAMAMQNSMLEIAKETGVDIQMRIGLNTGEVLVGTSSAGGDYTAMGDVMNLGSRIQSVAEAGQVWVGPDTRQATEDSISYEHAGQVAPRGRVGTLDAYVAKGATRPPGERRRRGSQFVGREHELELLTAQARMAFDQSRAQLAMVIGEPGMGKTRVAEEAADGVTQLYEARVLEGRCVPYGEANVWWPIAEIIRQGLHIGLDAPRAHAQSVLAARIGDLVATSDHDEHDRMVEALLHVMGYETSLRGGTRLRNRSEVMLAVTAVLEALLAERPVVLLISDTHWAPEAFWALLDHLMAELSRARLFVMLTAKDNSTIPDTAGHGSLILYLGPLDDEASRALLAQMGVDLEDEAAAELVRRSGGNPFYLEELATLVGSGAEGLTPMSKLSLGQLSSLPTTLRGAVAARLDALGASQRAVLEDASVRGRTGPVAGLEFMAKDRGEENFDAVLNALVAADLIKVAGSRYEFRSDLVRDIAYGTLTKTVRAQRHYKIATYLEEKNRGSERIRNSFLIAIADHYRWAAVLCAELAGVPGIDLAEVTAKALNWLEQAGNRALATDPATAEAWFDAAVNLASDDPTRNRFIYGRAKARCEMRDISGARSDLERLNGHIDYDPSLVAKALLVEGDVDRKAGDFSSAAASLREAAAKLEVLDHPAEQALAFRLLGITEMFRRNEELARQAFERSRQVALGAGDRLSEAWAIQSLAWQAFRLGRVSEAKELLAPALAVFSELDDVGGLTWTRGLQAWVLFHDGDMDAARKLVDQILPESRRRGDLWAEGITLILKCSIELWTGQATKAWEYSRLAMEAADDAEDFGLAVQARALEGRALVSRGRIAEGTAALEQAYSLAERAGDEEAKRFAVVSNCASAARAGESERAIRWAARYQSPHDDISIVGRTELVASMALALLQRGSVKEAAAQLAVVDQNRGSERWYQVSVAALISAALGHTDEALAGAQRVLNGSSTYLDKLKALAAQAAALHQMGDKAARDQSVAAGRAVLKGVDDRLSPLLFELLAGLLGLASLEEAEHKLGVIGVDPTGWKTAFELVVDPRAGARILGAD